MLRSRCKCGQETTPEVLGQASLYLSMGVVLQLLFYDDFSKAPCGHNLFRDRVEFWMRADATGSLLPAG